MKTLELNRMEQLQGGGYTSGVVCGLAVLAWGALIVGTGGLGAFACLVICGIGCAGAIESEQ